MIFSINIIRFIIDTPVGKFLIFCTLRRNFSLKLAGSFWTEKCFIKKNNFMGAVFKIINKILLCHVQITFGIRYFHGVIIWLHKITIRVDQIGKLSPLLP